METLSKNQIRSFIEGLKNGSKTAIPFDDEAEKELYLFIKLINEIGTAKEVGHLFDYKQAYKDIESDDPSGYSKVKIEGGIRVRMFRNMTEVPILTKDDLLIDEIIEKCIEDKTKVEINITPELKKYASKLTRKAGLKFVDDEGVFYIDGRTKSKPYIHQIQDAYKKGLDCIYFDSNEVSVLTIRVYASTVGNDVLKKFSCSVSGGKICVRFKEKSISGKFIDELEKVKTRFSQEMSVDEMKQNAINVFEEIDNDEF